MTNFLVTCCLNHTTWHDSGNDIIYLFIALNYLRELFILFDNIIMIVIKIYLFSWSTGIFMYYVNIAFYIYGSAN